MTTGTKPEDFPGAYKCYTRATECAECESAQASLSERVVLVGLALFSLFKFLASSIAAEM